MEQQTLPNSKAILILGILSIPLCCCYGIAGLAMGVIALVLAKKATALYLENPDEYIGIKNVKTGKVLAIIGIVLGVLMLLFILSITFFVSEETVFEWQRQLEEMRAAQE
ncbi:MAG: hypothetical protein ACI849_001683 [Patiriisocius sp.]|jgi:hypothetical protein